LEIKIKISIGRVTQVKGIKAQRQNELFSDLSEIII
jgi:hypothetical protein